MDNKVGNFLYELRKEKGVTQAELGEIFGISNKAVSKWETGGTLPDTSLLSPLAKLYGITVDEILNGERNGSAGAPDGSSGPPNGSAPTDSGEYKPNGQPVPVGGDPSGGPLGPSGALQHKPSVGADAHIGPPPASPAPPSAKHKKLFLISAACAVAVMLFLAIFLPVAFCGKDGALPTYEVTFNSNGGSAVAKQTSIQSGALLTRPSDPSFDGYKFSGWYKDTGLIYAWDFASDTVTKNTTLYAKWVKNETPPEKFTVTFASNGGSAVGALLNVENGAKITKPPNPVLEGHTFDRWYKDEGLTYAWDFVGDTVTKNTTLYAKWTKDTVHTHEFGDWTVTAAPTCIANGVETRACALDGTHTETRYIDTLGHDFELWAVSDAPTCTTAGTEARTCIRCGATETRPGEVALGHNFELWAVTDEPTCTTAGTETRNCIRCGETETRPGDAALGHAWAWVVTVPASVEATGLETKTCLRCGAEDGTRPVSPLLPTPTNLYIDPSGLLTWNAAIGADGYKVSVGSAEHDVPGTSLNLSALGLTTHGVYLVKVRAVGEGFDNSDSATSPEIWYTVGTQGLEFTLIDDGTAYSVARGTVTGGAVYIPAYHNLLPVTEIASSAFTTIDITNVTVPATVTVVGRFAFDGRASLESVDFETGSQLKTICYAAFRDCSSLKTIAIPENTASIESFVFYRCNAFESMTLPFVGDSVGGTYTNLGYLFNAMGYSHNETGVPPSLKTVTVTGGGRLDRFAFYRCTSLKTITLQAGVTVVGWNAFSLCTNMENVIFEGDALTGFEYRAFYNCTSLTDFTVPDSVTSIADSAFAGCSSLYRLSLPFVGNTKNGTSNTHFGYIFGASGYSGQNTSVPASLKSVVIRGKSDIAANAFNGCSALQTIYLPSSVESIGTGAFSGCSNLIMYAEPVSQPASWLSLLPAGRPVYWGVTGSAFFENDKAHYVLQGENAILTKYVGDAETFDVLALALDAPVTRIGSYAFSGSSIINVSIPESVTEIGSNTFASCLRLTLFLNSNEPPTQSTSFESVRAIVVPIGAEDSYKDAWTAYESMIYSEAHVAGDKFVIADNTLISYFGTENMVEIPEGVTKIANHVFRNRESLQKIMLPDSLAVIGMGSFQRCTNLAGITLPKGLTEIGQNAFYGCTSLQSITISADVATIGFDAFYVCDNLTIYTEASSRLGGWNTSWNYASRPVAWGCATTQDESGVYVVSFTRNSNSISYPTAPNGIKAPYREGYTFGGWAISAVNAQFGIVTYWADQLSSVAVGTTLYAIWE
ncbi:MAG: leucine-rich repeat protein [Firmicutes bacterium]|nr:leucine-rich repeat protein [Bacillota bacterium]